MHQRSFVELLENEGVFRPGGSLQADFCAFAGGVPHADHFSVVAGDAVSPFVGFGVPLFAVAPAALFDRDRSAGRPVGEFGHADVFPVVDADEAEETAAPIDSELFVDGVLGFGEDELLGAGAAEAERGGGSRADSVGLSWLWDELFPLHYGCLGITNAKHLSWGWGFSGERILSFL